MVLSLQHRFEAIIVTGLEESHVLSCPIWVVWLTMVHEGSHPVQSYVKVCFWYALVKRRAIHSHEEKKLIYVYNGQVKVFKVRIRRPILQVRRPTAVCPRRYICQTIKSKVRSFKKVVVVPVCCRWQA